MKRLLIVDDERRITDLYQRLFEAAGMKVFSANTAERASFLLFSEPVDLVLLDINMPLIDGKAVYDVIQEFDPEKKVIVISVYPIKRQKELIPNALDYYDKSEGAIGLLEKVKAILA